MSKNKAADSIWRARLKGVQYELTLDELSRWIVNGRISDENEVQSPGSSTWAKAKSVAELKPAFDERDRMRPQTAASRRNQEGKATVGLSDEERREKILHLTRRAGFLIIVVSLTLAALLFSRASELALKIGWFGSAAGIIVVLYTFTGSRE